MRSVVDVDTACLVSRWCCCNHHRGAGVVLFASSAAGDSWCRRYSSSQPSRIHQWKSAATWLWFVHSDDNAKYDWRNVVKERADAKRQCQRNHEQVKIKSGTTKARQQKPRGTGCRSSRSVAERLSCTELFYETHLHPHLRSPPKPTSNAVDPNIQAGFQQPKGWLERRMKGVSAFCRRWDCSVDASKVLKQFHIDDLWARGKRSCHSQHSNQNPTSCSLNDRRMSNKLWWSNSSIGWLHGSQNKAVDSNKECGKIKYDANAKRNQKQKKIIKLIKYCKNKVETKINKLKKIEFTQDK